MKIAAARNGDGPDSFWETSKSYQTAQSDQEFGRHQDVRRLFGIKRGILYRLINEGKIRSITLREPGRRFGCRLIYLPSVRTYLNSLLEAQTERNPAESTDVPVGSVDCDHRVTRLRLQGRA